MIFFFLSWKTNSFRFWCPQGNHFFFWVNLFVYLDFLQRETQESSQSVEWMKDKKKQSLVLSLWPVSTCKCHKLIRCAGWVQKVCFFFWREKYSPAKSEKILRKKMCSSKIYFVSLLLPPPHFSTDTVKSLCFWFNYVLASFLNKFIYYLRFFPSN